MSDQKAVVFDIGNVLLEWDPDKLFKRLVPDEAAREAFYANADMEAMNEAIDLGAPFRKTIYAHAQAHPKYSDLIRAWHDNWLDMATPLIDGSWEVLRQLRSEGVPVLALSNFGTDSFALAEKTYPALKEFDQRFISGHLGVIKPDPAIYEIVESQSGFTPENLFFIDDRKNNIDAAQKRGWQTHLFASPENLRESLKKFLV
jgi:2-haloacid dehalogenase